MAEHSEDSEVEPEGRVRMLTAFTSEVFWF